MRALIIGGGIGGLAAAIALHRSGWRVQVLERAAEFTEVGAGLSTSPTRCARWTRWLWATRSAPGP